MTEFFCPGLPRPKGSMKAFVAKGRAFITNASPQTRPWQDLVAWYARQAGLVMLEGPVSVGLCFYLPRPKKPKHEQHVTKPDIDKLTRSVLDALTLIAWKDDSQVVRLEVAKLYAHDGPEPGVRVRVGGV